MTDEVDKELLNEFYQELADLIGLRMPISSMKLTGVIIYVSDATL